MHIRRRTFLALVVLGAACVTLWVCSAAAASPALDAAKTSTVALTDSTEGIFGSGVVVAPGYVLTAAHVVDAGLKAGLDQTVVDSAGDERAYAVLVVDSERDLALIELEGPIGRPMGLQVAPISSGDDVWALGFPLGLKGLVVTKGIVSSVDQEIDGHHYLQTDASINPGNSGGPLVDASGHLVGVNVMKVGHVDIDNVGFAVPMDVVAEFLESTPVGSQLGAPASVVTGVASGNLAGGGSPSDGSGLLILLLGGVVVCAIAWLLISTRRVSPSDHVPVRLATPSSSSDFVLLRVSGPQGSFDRSVQLPAVIGRASDVDVVLADEQVSRHHASLSWDASATSIVVRDLGSRNGISGGTVTQERRLAPDEAVVVGNTTVRWIG